MRHYIFSWGLPILIVFLGLFLSSKTDILKDDCQCEIKPYSFARTQLMWWTLIIISCYSIYYGNYGIIQELNKSTLILLGISLGTTTTARIIDNTEINNGILRHQNDHEHSRGFFNNILSDGGGISVHRFQALIFNLLFGLIFIVQFLESKEGKFTEFGQTELALMGISSAAYVGLKLNENR